MVKLRELFLKQEFQIIKFGLLDRFPSLISRSSCEAFSLNFAFNLCRELRCRLSAAHIFRGLQG